MVFSNSFMLYGIYYENNSGLDVYYDRKSRIHWK